ncbi:MAG: hypothetical protein CMJ64_03540 [Planctomycetaceae bacterium]|nr:hypothetical protein [Planctomycetaceae bacterium]
MAQREWWTSAVLRYRADHATTVGTPTAPRATKDQQAEDGQSSLEVLREKLEHFRVEAAITADPAQKFSLKKQIEEVEQAIKELGG